MFRAGPDEVIDATLRGGRARYINHSCDPNCFAAIHTLPADPLTAFEGSGDEDEENNWMGEGMSDSNGEHMLKRFLSPSSHPTHAPPPSYSGRKVLVYALRRIAAGEELLYDYCFSQEEATVPCLCKAANCRGTINVS